MSNCVRMSMANTPARNSAVEDRHQVHDADPLVVQREDPRRDAAAMGEVVVGLGISGDHFLSSFEAVSLAAGFSPPVVACGFAGSPAVGGTASGVFIA